MMSHVAGDVIDVEIPLGSTWQSISVVDGVK